MVNLDRLGARGLRAYEFGRFRMASKVALVILPLAAVCLIEPNGREACACCAAVLLLSCAFLRFRNRAGIESVATGLLGGSVPLVFALALPGFWPSCAAAGLFSACTAFSILIGGAAGAVVAVREV